MSDIQIDDGVAIPTGRANSGGRPRASKYPFAIMQPGQSFAFPKDRLKTINAALARFRRLNKDKAFTCRQTDENTCRVWRVS